MNWEAIGAIGEVGGAIAVVVTLVYLARQIRQNTQATKVSAYHQAEQHIYPMSVALSTDPELAQILGKAADQGVESLARSERIRLDATLSTYFFGFESLLAHHEKGLIDADLWQNFLDNNVQYLSTPLWREYLAARRGALSRRLGAIVDERPAD
jgi:hypothetical protein